MRTPTAIAGAVLAAAACAPRRSAPPAPTPVPAAELPPAPVPHAGASPTRFTWSPAPRRLEVRTTVEIVREGAPPSAGEPPEQVRVVTYLTDTLAAGAAPGSVRALGVVDSVLVTASARVRGDAAGSSAAEPRLAPLRYQAASDVRGVRVDPAPDAGADLRCAAPTGAVALGALAAVRETLPRVPAGAAPGARWRDTTVAANCAGPVLLVVRTVSRYEATPGENGVLAVVRRSTSTFHGQGAAGMRPVTVSGTGTGELRYLLDPARGALAGGTGESRTVLAVTVAGVAQRFVQHARTEVVAR